MWVYVLVWLRYIVYNTLPVPLHNIPTRRPEADVLHYLIHDVDVVVHLRAFIGLFLRASALFFGVMFFLTGCSSQWPVKEGLKAAT